MKRRWMRGWSQMEFWKQLDRRQINGPRPRSLAWVLVWVFGISLGYGQSQITLKSGRTVECTVLEYANGIFHFEMPDGSRRVTSQDNVARIEFRAEPSTELPPEFGLEDAPAQVPPTLRDPTFPGAPPPPPVASPPAPSIACTAKLKLASNWQLRLARGNLALKDTARLLSRCGTPQIDLEGKPITIWNKVTYLMPIQEAKKLLGLGLSTRSALTCAAFAPNSFFCHAFSGSFDEGFNRVFILTDFADQVVGIQWQDNVSQDKRWFPYCDSYSQDWSQYNFVGDRRKGNPNWFVGFYVCQGSKAILGYPPRTGTRDETMYGPTGVNEGVVRIDSDLFSVTKDRWEITIDEKSRERNRLLLAQPIVDLMLYIVQKSN